VPLDASLVAAGKYLAAAGDCTACHTNPGGAAFAGGLPIASPIGTIYATNITPDKDTGIGGWTYEDFARLMRKGITKQGYVVYPAMPYPSYSRLTDGDLRALYAYFMLGVQPVNQANQKPGIPWPLSMPAAQSFVPADGQDAATARGEYLVEGLGHCGSCHTPREITLQEVALTGTNHPSYLAGGGAIDGWIPPNLRGDVRTGLGAWREDDIVAFLKTGSNTNFAAFGGMTQVVHDSTQYLTDADLHAIAKYLKTLPGHNNETAYQYDPSTAKALTTGDASKPGAAVYLANCDVCHGSNGMGYSPSFPALAGNPVVAGTDPTSLINIVLAGARKPETAGSPSRLAMPSLGYKLSDQQVADVLTFVRGSWGNQAAMVTLDQVAQLRKSYKPMPASELSP
jgi:mono/diheme cytochrome c family protein